MNRALLVLPLIALAACTAAPAQDPAPQPQPTTPPARTTTAQAPGTPPPAPEPSADGQCPYLESAEVADANGQRVGGVKISDGKPPSCFFYRSDGSLQLSVRVFTGEPALAEAVVDEAAPVATSNPATAPAGWEGGSLAGDDGAVYAVAKGGTAVVVTSNQEQTIKARRITESVIESLGL
ncbi:DUF2020 domain-containing protein [Actinokineospora guangxiensis]|uniref:DUF2020 domain-containing protein n=1 Tax=Actinokineospora guangxiensis TaxID=1490288 RepID=A0ABW0EJ35_9PSEU